MTKPTIHAIVDDEPRELPGGGYIVIVKGQGPHAHLVREIVVDVDQAQDRDRAAMVAIGTFVHLVEAGDLR